MTTANKIPANWPDALKMADAVADLVKPKVLHYTHFLEFSEEALSPVDWLYIVAELTEALQNVGKLVGMPPEDLGKPAVEILDG